MVRREKVLLHLLSALTLLVTAQEAKFGKANQQCYDQMIGHPCHLQG